MPTERQKLVDSLYHAALKRNSGSREVFLNRACAGDAELRREVSELLEFDERAGEFLEEPALQLAARQVAARQEADSVFGANVPEEIGPYKVRACLGKGGMGEVYLATDPRLNRNVAIKLLPPEFADDGERLQRFEQEARAASALNHPNIITIHEIGAAGGHRYIVTEHIEGKTLRDRLEELRDKGMPQEEALEFGVQIARALQAAHEAGIVHRDIKPENIMVRKDGLVKVLDFGLAKVSRAHSLAGATLESLNTRLGIVMGTAAYMSPEQARGESVDHRTDIFSFGVILYEMIEGKRPFEGDTAIDVVAAILTSRPAPLGAAKSGTSAGLQRVVDRCLEKKPEKRFQSAGDLAFSLENLHSPSPQRADGGIAAQAPESGEIRRPLSRNRRAALCVAGAAVVILGLLGWTRNLWYPLIEGKPSAGFTFDLPAKWSYQSFEAPAVSPDGKYVVFSAFPNSSEAGLEPVIWLRSMASDRAEPLSGTAGGLSPFWSPDSHTVAFWANGQLRTISISGGSAATICDSTLAPAPRDPRTPQSPARQGQNGLILGANRQGTWAARGTILISVGPRLGQVAATGGQAVALGPFAADEISQSNPRFLPDGDHFLYYARNADSGNDGIYIASLSVPGERKLLLPSVGYAACVPSGYLLYVVENTLMAQPFDMKQLALTGQAVRIADGVVNYAGSPLQVPFAAFTASDNGVLAWHVRGNEVVAAQDTVELTWFDRAGRRLGTVGEPSGYSGPALSPDETRLAVARMDPKTNTRDIWLMNLSGGAHTRLTLDPADDMNPVWTPDGKWVIFSSARSGHRNIYRKAADGTGDVEPLLESMESMYVETLSPDGRFLIFNSRASDAQPPDLAVLSLDAGQKRTLFESSAFREDHARFAPNGKWVAFRSGETSDSDIFVQAFGAGGEGKGSVLRITNDGGRQPEWRGDGKEIFYIKGKNTLMAMDVNTDGLAFSFGVPRPLFSVGLEADERRNRFVVTRDGQRFLVCALAAGTSNSAVQVRLNWLLDIR